MTLKVSDIKVGDMVTWLWNGDVADMEGPVRVATIDAAQEIISAGGYAMGPEFPEEWATLKVIGTRLPDTGKIEFRDATTDGAVKYDAGKLRYDLIPWQALRAFVWPYTYGASKYTDNNWKKGMKFSRALGAMKRHLADFEAGVDYDAASGSMTLAQVAWYCAAIIYYQVTGKAKADGLDDRDTGTGAMPFNETPTEPYKDGKPLFKKEPT